MGLVEYQSIIFLKVDDVDYRHLDEKIRDAVAAYPRCKITLINMQHFLWGANVWVTVETVDE